MYFVYGMVQGNKRERERERDMNGGVVGGLNIYRGGGGAGGFGLGLGYASVCIIIF